MTRSPPRAGACRGWPSRRTYAFDGPHGKVSLLDLFEGRRQLIVYRAFFEPGVHGWPEQACRGCSHGRRSGRQRRPPQCPRYDPGLRLARAAGGYPRGSRPGWAGRMPWFTITDDFDADFGVDEWHGTQRVPPRRRRASPAPTSSTTAATRPMGGTWSYLDITPLGRAGGVGGLAEGYPQTPPYKWWNWNDSYDADAAPDRRWFEVSGRGGAAFRNKDAKAPPSHEPRGLRRGTGGDAIRRSVASGSRLTDMLALAASPHLRGDGSSHKHAQ